LQRASQLYRGLYRSLSPDFLNTYKQESDFSTLLISSVTASLYDFWNSCGIDQEHWRSAASPDLVARMTHEIVDNPLTEAEIVTSETPMNVQTDPPTKKRKNAQAVDVRLPLHIRSPMLTNHQANKKPKVQENRAIYVSNLPRDTNEAEIEEEFKKYGIIDQGADGNKRIKMYKDDEGNFNGDALIVYFKKDVRMMDEYYFRIEDQSQGVIRVKEADFSYKKNTDGEAIKNQLSRKDKKASERNRAELNRCVPNRTANSAPL
jgi:HIV Tat-specific factor 1